MTAANQPLELRAHQLCVRRGGNQILQNIDFVARAGSLIGVLGPSGSGKTTLLYALSGFRPANEGTVHLSGDDLYRHFQTLKGNIGFVPQDDIVPTALKVASVLRYAAELRLPELDGKARQARVSQLMTSLGLSERARLPVSSLSGGQRKRVSIAVELLSEPTLLFADEPTSGLDPALEATFMNQLRQMADEGRIVVLTTHIMSSLEQLDRVCIVVQGRLAFFGPPQRLKEYFEVDDFTQLYRKLDQRPGKQWYRQWVGSSLHRTYLGRG